MNRTTSYLIKDTDPVDAGRRRFLLQAGTGAGALAAGLFLDAKPSEGAGAEAPRGQAQASAVQPRNGPSSHAFWPNGTRLVVSVSMMFEAGGQPRKGTDSPFPKVDFPDTVPSDAAANTWFAYGYRDDERQFLTAARDMVEEVTGQRPLGYNANWLRRSPNTLSLLQELGYLYHIDDLSRDEPFIEQVNGADFVVVPYTLRNNDILLIEGRNYSPEKFLAQIKLDFDQLYDEAGSRRRMMSVSAHDRISGTPQMVKAWDGFLA